MTAATLLLDVHALGVRLEARGDRLHVDAPAGTLTPELRATLTREKPALLQALQDPRKTAYGAWEGVLSDVATRWERHAKEARTRGLEPRWIDDEALMGAVREAIKGTVDATTLGRALEAIERWKTPWMGVLASGTQEAGHGR